MKITYNVRESHYKYLGLIFLCVSILSLKQFIDIEPKLRSSLVTYSFYV